MADKARQLFKFLEKSKVRAMVPMETRALLAINQNTIQLAKSTTSLPRFPPLTLSKLKGDSVMTHFLPIINENYAA
jgi:hypothetical protein